MNLRLVSLALSALVAISACSSSDGPAPPPTGTLEVTVVDGDTSAGLSNVRVIVVDGSTGESIDTLNTDGTGKASKTYETGALQLRVSTQDYTSSPPSGIPPLPAQIAQDQTTAVTISLYPLAAANRGMISGQVIGSAGQAANGALVVVTADDGTTLSTISDASGGYVLHNVPSGPATVTAYLGGHNFPTTGPVSVTTNGNADQDIVASGMATGEISGHISFTATSGAIVDITLLHPVTRDSLPRLRVLTDSGASYQMTGVPYGEFEILASLENDGYVLDPDVSVTQGIPMVTITEVAPVLANEDFKVTGSIELTNPTTPTVASIPELGNSPTFTWLKRSSYASAEYYVVEVVDESGETIWGGFDSAANNFAPFVTVPQSNDPSAVYDFDGTAALASLLSGRYYQVRIYAAVTDVSEAKGYRLLSASETLDGIFRVAAP